MNERKIPDHAESLFYRFEAAGIPLLLAGGWAVCYHGYSRLTNDVDWICSREFEAEALRLMEDLQLDKRTDGMASRFVLRRDPTFPPMDLIWVNAKTFAEMSLTTDRTGRHQQIPVISFASLLAMKVFALKDDESRGGKDLLDIRSLLVFNPGQISEKDLQDLCLKFGGPDAYSKVRPNL